MLNDHNNPIGFDDRHIIRANVRIPNTVMLPEREYELVRRSLALRMFEVLEKVEGRKVFFSPIKFERFRRFDETEFVFMIAWGIVEERQITFQKFPEYPKMGFLSRLYYLFTGRFPA
jgi:hypothetical protein